VSRKSKKRAKQAIPEEILAEGSGPHGEEIVDVDAQSLADAATDALVAAEIAEVEAEVEAVAMAAEVVVTAADAALPVGVDAWGQPVVVDDSDPVLDDPAEPDTEAVEDAELATAGVGEEVGDIEGAALPTGAGGMEAAELKHLVEALVFAADKPVTIPRLRQLTRISDVRRLEAALAELAEDYAARGIALQVVSGGYQFRTNTHYSGWVQQLIAGRPVRLSRAQLETLAIVAYRQPITRPEIDEIRGVDSSSTLKVLLDRALIRILGKREEAGRPTLYGTTKEFLDFFSLGDLRELPTLREYSELTAESRKVVSERLGVGLDGAPVEPATDLQMGDVSELAEDAHVGESSEPMMPTRGGVSEPAEVGEPSEPMLAPHVGDVPELAADAQVGESPDASEPAADAHDGESGPMMASHVGDVPELAADSQIGESPDGSELAAARVGDPPVVSELVAAYLESREPLTDPHVGDPPELAAHVGESPIVSELADAHLESPEPLAGPHVGDLPELAADGHMSGSSDMSGEPDIAGGPDAIASDHGFLDPDDLAGRVIVGETDQPGSDRDDVAELDMAAGVDTPESNASVVSVADASAPDDPAVD
jgi:segregation and condensation protein B